METRAETSVDDETEVVVRVILVYPVSKELVISVRSNVDVFPRIVLIVAASTSVLTPDLPEKTVLVTVMTGASARVYMLTIDPFTGVFVNVDVLDFVVV